MWNIFALTAKNYFFPQGLGISEGQFSPVFKVAM